MQQFTAGSQIKIFLYFIFCTCPTHNIFQFFAPKCKKCTPHLEVHQKYIKKGYVWQPHISHKRKERETGFEPATLALARRCSTTEPLAHNTVSISSNYVFVNTFYQLFLFFSSIIFSTFFLTLCRALSMLFSSL